VEVQGEWSGTRKADPNLTEQKVIALRLRYKEKSMRLNGSNSSYLVRQDGSTDVAKHEQMSSTRTLECVRRLVADRP
jgi:hypothetical protein